MPRKKQRTPQEKKQLSYERDGRNAYNESSKGSRKAIPFRKHWVNQTYRGKIRKLLNLLGMRPKPLSETDVEPIENKVQETRRADWKKSPDMPLGEFVAKQKQQRDLRQQYGRHFKDVVGSDSRNWPDTAADAGVK